MIPDSTAPLKEFLHRVVSLDIRLTSYIPEEAMIKTTPEISPSHQHSACTDGSFAAMR
jgi:hypothetical protein